MKKAAALFLALAMLLTIAGCSMTIIDQSKGESAKDPPAATQPQEPASPEEPAAPDEPPQGEEPSIPAPEGPAEEAGADGTDAAPVIRTSHTDVTLFSAGETFRFTVWNSDGDEPDTCTYTSSDPEVAAVDEGGGEVTAVAPGTATITAHVDFSGEERDLTCIVRCKWEGAETPEIPEDTESAEPSQSASGTVEMPSLSDFFTTLQGQYEGLGAMMAMEGELLENYYPGLSGIASVEEVYIQETMISMANVAVGLVKLSDSATADDIAAVENVLRFRIDTQANGGAWYPASCETWEKGVITSTSNVVGMFVYPDEAQAMADLFTETFSN